jgi:LemA protein
MIKFLMVIFIAVFIFLVLLCPVIIFNRLIRLRNEVKNAWSQIDVQLKRRHDLVPNLVSVVKGYMDFERETLVKVTEARAGAIAASGVRDKAHAENILAGSLERLFVVLENYPQLKSNENAMKLQEELVTTENRIAFARQLYNDLVAGYRTRLEVFPDNIIASVFSFRPYEYFSAGASARSLPSAKISPGA